MSETFTPPTRDELARFSWWEDNNCLTILDLRTQSRVRFRRNNIQQRFYQHWLWADANDIPFRTIVLKARRMGMSTAFRLRADHRGLIKPDVRNLTVAHETPSAEVLHGITELLLAELPAELTPQIVAQRRGQYLHIGHGSQWDTRTAGADTEGGISKRRGGSGRGRATTQLLASEAAYYPDMDATLGALLQTVPPVVGTAVCVESTANGMGGPFFDLWERSKRGETDFIPQFYAWHQFDLYRLPVPEGGLGRLDDEEQALKIRFQVTDEQLAWRRSVMRNECLGDPDYFHQEYPADDLEAFIVSGSPFFPAPWVRDFKWQRPRATGELKGEVSKGAELRFEHDAQGPLWIWDPPRRGPKDTYVMFVDPAGEMTQKQADGFRDEREAGDFTVFWLLDAHDGTTVAHWHARLDPDLAAEHAYRMARFYNDAWIAVETVGGHGDLMLHALKRWGYRRIYSMPGKVNKGWLTTNATRALMLDWLRVVLRDESEKLRSSRLRDEMATFVKGPRWRGQATSGAHDDLVLAAAGAYAVWGEMVGRVGISRAVNAPDPAFSSSAVAEPQAPKPRRPRRQLPESVKAPLSASVAGKGRKRVKRETVDGGKADRYAPAS